MKSLNDQFVGPMEALLPYLHDETITDILVNGARSFYIERFGALEALPHPLPDPTHLFNLVERILAFEGKARNASQPYVDGKLADGSRYHLLLPPVAREGPLLSIRKWRSRESVPLEKFGTPETMARIVDWVQNGKNLLISGGTGTGKTTLLGRLLDTLPPEQRLAILEESPEIQTIHPHTIRLESQPETVEGTAAHSLRTLVRNALRMRPDRIILGECRGEEAFDMIQAMNTGHSGSLTTLHANGARDALDRLEALILLASVPLTPMGVRRWIANNIHGVIHLGRDLNTRKIREIVILEGLEGELYRLTPWEF